MALRETARALLLRLRLGPALVPVVPVDPGDLDVRRHRYAQRREEPVAPDRVVDAVLDQAGRGPGP